MKYQNQNSQKDRIKTFIVAAVALCLLTALAVTVYFLPVEATLFDTTNDPMYKISDDSLNFVAELTEDVTIYWLCADGQTNERLGNFLLAYFEEDSPLRLRIVNTTDNPDFAGKYTSTKLSNYSFIVESERRYQVIDVTDMSYYTNEYINYIAGSTYKIPEAQYDAMYAAYGTYMDQAETRAYFNGEAILTSALDYVTAEHMPQTYMMTGHGDGITSDSLKAIMTNAGLLPESLDLVQADRVPEDAGCIILFSPETDLSEHEADLLKEHVRGGGSFLLVAGPNTSDFTNLASVTALFGMSPSAGIVLDTNTQYYKTDPSYLLPLINSNHPAMYAIGSMGYLAYMPESMGIAIDTELPQNVTATAMLGTSDNGYRASKDSARTPLCKPAAQIVAASAIMEVATADGTADNAYFAWFASDKAFTDAALANTSYGNYYYLAMTAKWMTEDEQYTSPYETLAADDLTIPMMDGMTASGAIVLGVLIMAVLPLGLLTVGIVIWLKRRNR